MTTSSPPVAGAALGAGPRRTPTRLYLDTLRLALTGLAHSHTVAHVPGIERAVGADAINALRANGLDVVRVSDSDRTAREEGLDWPIVGETMVGEKRLAQLQRAVEDVLARGVPGDLIETGVWRGGASILMRGVLAAYGDEHRTVYVCDSFEGLPKPDAALYPADAGDSHHEVAFLRVSLEEVQANFARYGLLDDQVRFLKGWFKDTLPGVRDSTWSVVRLDGDMYESTMDGLVNLYPGLSEGGIIVIDDWNAVAGCKQAVLDYRAEHGITDAIEPIDHIGVFWRKS